MPSPSERFASVILFAVGLITLLPLLSAPAGPGMGVPGAWDPLQLNGRILVALLGLGLVAAALVARLRPVMILGAVAGKALFIALSPANLMTFETGMTLACLVLLCLAGVIFWRVARQEARWEAFDRGFDRGWGV